MWGNGHLTTGSLLLYDRIMQAKKNKKKQIDQPTQRWYLAEKRAVYGVGISVISVNGSSSWRDFHVYICVWSLLVTTACVTLWIFRLILYLESSGNRLGPFLALSIEDFFVFFAIESMRGSLIFNPFDLQTFSGDIVYWGGYITNITLIID